MFSERYVDRMISYHAGIFPFLIAGGEIRDEDPDTLAWMYVSVITLLSVCDRQPEREAKALKSWTLKCKAVLPYLTLNEVKMKSSDGSIRRVV